jgi:hypothetical protein
MWSLELSFPPDSTEHQACLQFSIRLTIGNRYALSAIHEFAHVCKSVWSCLVGVVRCLQGAQYCRHAYPGGSVIRQAVIRQAVIRQSHSPGDRIRHHTREEWRPIRHPDCGRSDHVQSDCGHGRELDPASAFCQARELRLAESEIGSWLGSPLVGGRRPTHLDL